jgi:hypothetical protein
MFLEGYYITFSKVNSLATGILKQNVAIFSIFYSARLLSSVRNIKNTLA